MIPETTTNFSPWLKMFNPLKDAQGKATDVKEGDVVTVVSELHSPASPKIKSFILGEVELINGEKRTLGINFTSYLAISKAYGVDTADWLNKQIIYRGFKQLSKGNGYLWEAVI